MMSNNKVKLEFNIKISERYDESLDIRIKIDNCPKVNRLDLYKGAVHISGFRCYDSEREYIIKESSSVLYIYFQSQNKFY